MHIPFIVFGLAISFFGIWLIWTPRQSRIGAFLGPMIRFRLFGYILVLFGLLALAAGLGIDHIGSIPIKVKP